jgi:hypothetical protein
MIDESILKSNFLGRDGFRWWIGQVPPIGSQKGQANGEGWGNRLKVRILGYHPADPNELSNDDLPWAQVMLPTTTGSGAGSYAVNPKVRPGDTVLGFFLDGDNAQIPVIMGCFGRTGEVPSSQYLAPFVPFTGYTNRVKKPNGTLAPSEASEDSTQAQKSPRRVPPETSAKLNEDSEAEEGEKNEVSYSTAIGKKLVLATTNDTKSASIEAETYNLIKKVNDPFNKVLNKVAEVSKATDKIMGIVEGIVGQCTNSLYTGLIPILQAGLTALYKGVYAAVFAATGNAAVAHLAGVAAQKAMVIPVKALQSMIPKIPGMVVNTLFGTVQSMMTDVVDNVKKPNSCVSHQVTAGIINEILRKIQGGLSGVLGGVNKILSAGFNVIDFLTSGVAAIKGISGFFDVNQNKNKSYNSTDVWKIGIGPANIADKLLDYKEILDNMNRANAARKNLSDEVKSGVDGVKAGFDVFSEITTQKTSKCYTGPSACTSPPRVKFFGGMGKGALGEIIMGNFERNPLGEVISGSIIGVNVLNGGENYKYPPFVEIVDDCDLGYGAVARSVINEEGVVTGVYIASPGESYPIGNVNINTGQVKSETNPENLPNYVDKVIVQTTGTGYKTTDPVFDDIGNVYNLTVDPDGSIIEVNITSPPPDSPLITGQTPVDQILLSDPFSSVPIITNQAEFTPNNYLITLELPTITINSNTGSGAILRPVLKKIPFNTDLLGPDGRIDPQKLRKLRTIKFVKDCVGGEEQLIGYVNGDPYYGPFHVHPLTGVRMVGAVHIDEPHEIIYNTREESLGKSPTTAVLTPQPLDQRQPTSVTPNPTPTTDVVTFVADSTPTPAPAPAPAPAPTPTPAPAPAPSPSPSPTPPPSGGGGGGGYGGY